MILDVSKGLRMPGDEIPFSLSDTLPPQEILGDVVSFPQPVSLVGRYCVTGEDSIVVEGELTCEAVGTCSRCLASVTLPLRTSFHEVFVSGTEPDDPERFSYRGTKLDLSLLTLTLTVLELPMRFLCREDCKGLCPVCGANLNEGDCTCPRHDDAVSPFTALDQLLKKDEEV